MATTHQPYFVLTPIRSYPPCHALSSFSLFLFLFIAAAQSAMDDAGLGEFFAGASAGTALYSVEGAAFGGDLAAGYGFDIGALSAGLDYPVDTDLPASGIVVTLRMKPSGTNESGYVVPERQPHSGV
jgi:hypothetical protein